ncbi:hypothetical protein Ddye_002756 [Dipteronia dyeriana]|uniref:Uncharacterized protein n=1 Tax=Dipteronia dyeriana TaxID=168575 RepID=A0AAE0CUP8_9ROSI|nr:hypothetical protein Ddye_002756 [Dipteronia dyeriana]
MTFSVSLIVYVQSYVMFLSCTLFLLGSRIYVKVKPQGSPLTSVAQVVVAATEEETLETADNHDPHYPSDLTLFNHMPTDSMNSTLPHTDQFRFLDKAAIITADDRLDSDGSAAKWRLCSIQQVEEIKCVVRIIPILSSAIIFHVASIQQQTYAVFQALQSDRSIGSSNFLVPTASYMVFSMLSLTLWIPIYDWIVVSCLQKLTGKEGGMTLLQRMGIGLVLSVLTVFVSGFIEKRGGNLALTRPTLGIAPKGGAISSMSGLWLIPQLKLAGLSEAFNATGQIEFYYKQFHENMRSIACSCFFLV